MGPPRHGRQALQAAEGQRAKLLFRGGGRERLEVLVALVAARRQSPAAGGGGGGWEGFELLGEHCISQYIRACIHQMTLLHVT